MQLYSNRPSMHMARLGRLRSGASRAKHARDTLEKTCGKAGSRCRQGPTWSHRRRHLHLIWTAEQHSAVA